jgi:6-pyruvoyltetrahydropterin/6-carboxytetrahydropterin synthase
MKTWKGIWKSEDEMMTLTYIAKFDAAHFLPDYVGPCGNLHGHTWRVEVEIAGSPNPETGMIVDFKEIKTVLEAILPDHTLLNTHPLLAEIKFPTAESLSLIFFYEIKKSFPGLRRVTVWESDHASASYVES